MSASRGEQAQALGGEPVAVLARPGRPLPRSLRTCRNRCSRWPSGTAASSTISIGHGEFGRGRRLAGLVLADPQRSGREGASAAGQLVQELAESRVTVSQHAQGLEAVDDYQPRSALPGSSQPGGPAHATGASRAGHGSRFRTRRSPSLTPPRWRAWELARYRAYQAHLRASPSERPSADRGVPQPGRRGRPVHHGYGRTCRTVTALSRRARSRHGSRPGNPAR